MSARILAVAASILLGIAPAVGGQTLGRFFSTVDERLRLDEIRDQYQLGTLTTPVVKAAKRRPADTPEPSTAQFEISGVVLRSSGHNSSWLNGTRIPGGQRTGDGVRIEPTRGGSVSVRLVLPSGVDTAPIRPGQRIDVATGHVLESFQRAEERKPEDAPPAGLEASAAPRDRPDGS